jgi:putative intracellular protease/amidase
MRNAGSCIFTWLVLAVLHGCGSEIELPPAPHDSAAAEQQKQAFVQAMKPRRAGRPVVAIVALNEGTELTDFLLPHALLVRSGLVDVQPVAVRRGKVSLYPAFEVRVAHDFESFARAYPNGADYVIVPAMVSDDAAPIAAFLRSQKQQGARIIGVCLGGRVVGRAGLLDGRHFVTHWYARETLLERHAGSVYVPHRRFVFDRDVATTTGITASLPTMLSLVEAMGGHERAATLASELGVASWTPEHDSSRFGLTFERAFHYVLAKLSFWRNEQWSVEVDDGMDDIALALVVDAWSRSGHVRVHASAAQPVTLRSGMVLEVQPAKDADRLLRLEEGRAPMQQLERTLCEIGARFGAARREWATIELEYSAPIECGD